MYVIEIEKKNYICIGDSAQKREKKYRVDWVNDLKIKKKRMFD